MKKPRPSPICWPVIRGYRCMCPNFCKWSIDPRIWHTRHYQQAFRDHGALLLLFTAGCNQIRQVVCVAENVDGFHFSETAMKDLGIIPQNFPSCFPRLEAGTTYLVLWMLISHDTTISPGAYPIPPAPETRDNLKTSIHNHSANRAFKTRLHQALHIMPGKPMHITFRPDAMLSAVHTPIPVPTIEKKQWKLTETVM